MTEPRVYHSRSTRDGLGHRPDGTHPCTADGAPAFDRFTFEDALDFIMNTPAPSWGDLVESVGQLKLNRTVYAMRSILDGAKEAGDTPEALPYWQALYVLTRRIQAPVAAAADPFSTMDLRDFLRALDATGIPALQAAGLLQPEEDAAVAAPAPVPAAAAATLSDEDAFACIISASYPEGL